MGHEPKQKDTHHRINRKQGKYHIRGEPIEVNAKLHRFFHALFGAKNTYEIAKDLNEHWIDPNFFLLVVKRRTPDELHE
jgi:hypothetical protein